MSSLQFWKGIVLVPLFLIFFVPSFAVGEKRIFISDLYWSALPFVLFLGGKLRINSKLALKIISLIFIFLAVYLHGIYRVDLTQSLEQVDAHASGRNGFSTFSWIQDGILLFRFASWAIAFLCLKEAFNEKSIGDLDRARLHNLLLKAWSNFAVIESFIAVLAYFSSLRIPLGHFYGYDPDYVGWSMRFYGTFSSPAELGMMLFPPLLWLCCQKFTYGIVLRAAIIIAALIGSRSATAMVGAVLGCIYLNRSIFRRYKSAGLIFVFLALFVGIGLRLPIWDHTIFYNPFILWKTKINNFTFRFGPWWIFLKAIFSRPDYTLLGLGFARSHSDNSFIQLLRTGGLALVSLYFYFIYNLRTQLKKLSIQVNSGGYVEWMSAFGIAFLVTNLATDSIIYRGIGTLFFMSAALTPRSFHQE